MSAGELTGDQIRALLHELANRLAARDIHGDIKLIGSAALVLQSVGNRPTADIDAIYAEKTSINSIAAEMATDYDLALDWLNTEASAFIPDNARLLRKLNITNTADAVNLAFSKYGEHSIPLAASLENYLIVVDDALDAATTLHPETNH